MFLSDPAVNINPDVGRKVDMVRNAIWVAQRLGFARPKVAVLAAVEKINVKEMPATADAAILAKMGEAGQFADADIAGPYALDIAVSAKAAACKHITGPVAGCADILLCPDINSANIFYKSLIYFAGRELANAMIGVKTPLVMSSRSDSALTKLYTMALSVVLAGDEEK
jgi:phosphate butyryltransferase